MNAEDQITDPEDVVIHVGDTPLLEFECRDKAKNDRPVRIVGAITKDIYLRSPAGTIVKLVADYMTDGSDGLLKYQALKTTFAEVGVWYAEAFVVVPAYAGTGTGGVNIWTDSEASWETDEHAGKVLVDVAEGSWPIVSNTSEVLTLDADGETPTSGSYTITDLVDREWTFSGGRIPVKATLRQEYSA